MNALLQRKCGCGGSCGDCGEKKKRLQRSPLGSTQRTLEAPPAVHDVLRSPGRPLDASARDFFEPRFSANFTRVAATHAPQKLAVGEAGDAYEREADRFAAAVTRTPVGQGRADLSAIRVHTGADAAASARSVGARAYTVGSHIVFGAGEYAPHSASGRTLLAHELAHAGQQSDGVVRRSVDPAVPAAGPLTAPPPQFAANFTRMPVMLMRQVADPTIPLDAPGEPFPGQRDVPDCMSAVCTTVSAQKPRTRAQVVKVIGDWRTSTVACVEKMVKGSKARFAVQIGDQEKLDIAEDEKALLRFTSVPPADFVPGILSRWCTAKKLEVEAELRHNVILQRGSSVEWSENSVRMMDQALSLLPADVTWNSTVLTRFKLTGSVGTGIGGQTGYSRGDTTAEVDLPLGGLDKTPEQRVKSLNLLTGHLVVPHEIGHIVESRVLQADIDKLKQLMKWKTYPILGLGPGRAWRDEAKRELGLDDAKLDDLLKPPVGVDVAHELNGRRWVFEGDTMKAATPLRLNGARPDVLPMIAEFDYARTSFTDWFAEVYAIALSRPAFISSTLPRDVCDWFRDKVFRTPTESEWPAHLSGLGVTETPQLIKALTPLFTWQQAYEVLDRAVPNWRTAHGPRPETLPNRPRTYTAGGRMTP